MTQQKGNPSGVSELSGIEHYLQNIERTLLSREWLETRSKQELMDLVQFLSVQLYMQSTSQLKSTGQEAAEIQFPIVESETRIVFEPIPVGKREDESLKILMVGPKTSPLNRGYEIFGNAVVGRDDGSKNVDIDLTKFGSEVKGVSRQHAEFKVSGNKLYVMDLGSSNGTYLRGRRLEPNQAVEVPDGSVISFGALHVQVQIIRE